MDDESGYDVCKYSLGPVGGIRNPVASRTPECLDQGREGFARFIREAKDVTEIQNRTCNYFLDSTKKPDDEKTVTTFLDNVSEEELNNSVKRMQEQWVKWSSEDDKLRFATRERKRRALHPAAEYSSSSPKMAKMTQPLIDADIPAAVASGLDASPEKRLVVRSKKVFKVLKEEFQTLKAKLTRMSHPPLQSYDNDLEEFTVHNKPKIEKLQFSLSTIDKHIKELEGMLEEIVLPTEEQIPRDKIFLDFLDDGKKDKRNHHVLLVPITIKPLVELISVLSGRSLIKWEKLRTMFKKKSPEGSAALERQLDTWIANFHRCGRMVTQSSDSTDTLQGIPPMQDEDASQS